MLGTLRDGRLALAELHRFANVPVRLPTGMHWNLTELWHNVLVGIRKAAEHCRENGLELVSVGVDTWGVDYGLLTRNGELLGMPYCYRDERNPAAMRAVLEQLGSDRVYDATGIQFMPFNTMFQLAASRAVCPELLDGAARLAFLPDLLHYFLTGEAVNESTIVSTSQMVNPRGDASVAGSAATGAWTKDLLAELGLPTAMLGEIVPPGRRIGTILPSLAAELGLDKPVWVTLPACHDTASAVAAVPATGEGGWSFLSSGTWSLMGMELPRPLINAAAREANFTNERAADGAIRFLRNGTGLWLIQQLRASLAARGESYDYAQLTQLAAKAKPFAMRLDPEHGPFGTAGRMIEKMGEFASASGQALPTSPGELVRSCLEGLASSYAKTLADMRRLSGQPIDVIHIVGGGSRNELLNQMTADATGCTVVAGPTEATAAGNVLLQALGDGELATAQDLRAVVTQSFQPKVFQPP